ncbi:sulfatase-like hydrolase/transferase [Marinobacter zhanjiangensis]|uniref:Sulfatase N-terminal domain-containing protein n=1 Tax=Marinobacter zhanjiangensis TaxID=578215 RepID=A0ABQ3B0D1_9GAMM|nr:sulfatase-like hydrolase/transferase [Marinobacter zhanjiangensis]GGY70052.1 hypothetical protein GCM10007071_16230 [Marinobacter zhanjiangensis]
MKRLVILIFILNALLLALVVPGGASVPWIAIEGLVLAGLFLWLPAPWLRRGLAWGAGLLYGLSAMFVMLDTLVRASLGRPLNLYLDTSIMGASVDLLEANLGWMTTLLVFILALALCLVLASLVAGLLVRIGDLGHHVAGRHLAAGLAGMAVIGLILPVQLVGATAVRIGAVHAGEALDARQASQRFRERITTGTGGQAGDAMALAGLAETTVVLAFVESYGVSALFDERYRPMVQESLTGLEAAVEERGFHAVSGRLRSPVQGGQSWLAHGTLLSGLWIDSQQDYDALLSSQSPTLINDFQATGHQSVAVMPAITMAWPEGRALGYDRILDADAMGYLGPALNWVTMPDQYTWSRLHDTILGPSREPVFAELSLISSHAPWVPVLPVLEDWQSIGRGEVFEPWRGAGETPSSLWQDPERVRAQYARSVAYSIDVVASYLENRMDQRTLLVVLGDHQPAPLVTGEGASRDVPVHLISANPALIEPFVGTEDEPGNGLEGFRRGIWPGDQPGPAMDVLRPFLHRYFGVRGNISHP